MIITAAQLDEEISDIETLFESRRMMGPLYSEERLAELRLMKRGLLADTLFDKIMHGSEAHQEWMRNTINEHFGAKP